MRDAQGSTLVEVIIATALLAVLSVVLMNISGDMLEYYSRVESSTQLDQEAQYIASRINYTNSQSDASVVSKKSTITELQVLPGQLDQVEVVAPGTIQLVTGATQGVYTSDPILLTAPTTIHSMRAGSIKPSTTNVQYKIAVRNSVFGVCPTNDTLYTYVVDTTGNPPVLWYRMNEAVWTGVAGEVVNSGVGLNMNGQSTNASTTTGKRTRAGYFDGSTSRVISAHQAALNFSSAISIGVWVKFDTLPTGNIVRTILSKNEGGSYGLIANFATSGRLETYFHINGSYQKAGEALSGLAAGAWYYIAATYDGNTIKYYRDGALVQTIAATGTISTTTEPLTVGANPASGGTTFVDYFYGYIDELRIYDYARTQEQVITDMYGFSTSQPTDYFFLPQGAFMTGYQNPADCVKYKLYLTRPTAGTSTPQVTEIVIRKTP